MRRQRRTAMVAALMGLPAVAGLVIFIITPFALTFAFSFTDQRLISPLPTNVVGFTNYATLFGLDVVVLPALTDATGKAIREPESGRLRYPELRQIIRSDERYKRLGELGSVEVADRRITILARDPTFWRSLLTSAILVLMIVPAQGGLALLAAVLVNQRMRGVSLFRAAYFAPAVTPVAAMAVVWAFIYQPDQGLLNEAIRAASGGHLGGIGWLSTPDTALLSIVLLSAWQASGFQMLIFLAGLRQIPPELYEAAAVDGASAWQRFWYITIPSLRNALVLVVTTLSIYSFRLFTQIDIMTHGGPRGSTTTLFFHAVEEGFRQLRVGAGSAMTVVLFAIVVIVIVLQRRGLRSTEAYST